MPSDISELGVFDVQASPHPLPKPRSGVRLGQSRTSRIAPCRCPAKPGPSPLLELQVPVPPAHTPWTAVLLPPLSGPVGSLSPLWGEAARASPAAPELAPVLPVPGTTPAGRCWCLPWAGYLGTRTGSPAHPCPHRPLQSQSFLLAFGRSVGPKGASSARLGSTNWLFGATRFHLQIQSKVLPGLPVSGCSWCP